MAFENDAFTSENELTDNGNYETLVKIHNNKKTLTYWIGRIQISMI
jgi:hypothetical protein